MKRLILAMLGILCLSGAAQGALLTLSTHASDGFDPPPAEQLDATLDLSVAGSTLTLTVTNLTPENVSDPEFKMNEIFFNTSGDVTGLTLTDVIGSPAGHWDFTVSQDGIQVNGFGLYDVSLINGRGDVPSVINPGEVVTFVMDITGTGPFSDADFIQLSTQIDGHVESYGAAKFYAGTGVPPDASAYGATNIPEPATVILLGVGGGLMLLRYRRRPLSQD